MKKRTTSVCLAASIFVIALLTGCDEMYDDYDGEGGFFSDYDYQDDGDFDEDGGYEDYYQMGSSWSTSESGLGTCGELEGTTLLVSIYLDDAYCSWGSDDASVVYDGLKYLGMAADWISESAAAYGCNANFIYDWNSYSDLYYEGTVEVEMTDIDSNGQSIDYATWQFIDENIDSQGLLSKYSADNIAYIFFVNTPSSNGVTSCTSNYYEGNLYPYEMCYMFMFCDGEEEAPAAFAHEILHTFGAPDLYLVDTYGDNYGIPQELVDELERTSSNDIMYTTYDAYNQTPYYDRISNDFTDVDAYYVGLIDSCDFVDEWGLGASQH